MRALGPGVGYVEKQVTRKLTLDVKVPLLHVGCRIIRQGGFVAIPLYIDQRLIPSCAAGSGLNSVFRGVTPSGCAVCQGVEKELMNRLCGASFHRTSTGK